MRTPAASDSPASGTACTGPTTRARKILRDLAKIAAPELHRTAARTEEVALQILHEAHPERPNATNVDFWASVVLTGADIPKELFTCLFATSRVSGWTAHVLESLKDLRIIRPASRLDRAGAGQEAAAAGQAMSAEYVPGLEGIIAARTEISLVDGANGRLVYRGYVIADLAEEMSFEEVAHLLWNGSLPNRAELDASHSRAGRLAHAHTGRDRHPRGAAHGHRPDGRAAQRRVGAGRGAQAGEADDPARDPRDRIASRPSSRVLTGGCRAWNPSSRAPTSATPRTTSTCSTAKESSPEMVRALNTYLVLLADHGMNASTFTARVIASTDSDLASCLVGAIGALKGPAHGGAPSAVMDQLEQIGTADNAEHWMREARKRKVRFMGFGHRVYRTYDPRAKILKALCERLNPKFYELASKVEETALAILHEEHPERPQATNVEFYSAGVLQAIGLPKEYFPPTFAVSRVAGWSAHVLEQAAHNRLIRPQSEYIGPEPRKPVPLAER